MVITCCLICILAHLTNLHFHTYLKSCRSDDPTHQPTYKEEGALPILDYTRRPTRKPTRKPTHRPTHKPVIYTTIFSKSAKGKSGKSGSGKSGKSGSKSSKSKGKFRYNMPMFIPSYIFCLTLIYTLQYLLGGKSYHMFAKSSKSYMFSKSSKKSGYHREGTRAYLNSATIGIRDEHSSGSSSMSYCYWSAIVVAAAGIISLV